MTITKTASILALCMAAICSEAAPVLISTLPGPGDRTKNEITGVNNQWNDLAVGFVVPTAGSISHITAALTANAGFGGFVFGLATNALIGNPSTPTYFDPPPGSLWETRVCSTIVPIGFTQSACAMDARRFPGATRLALGPPDYFDVISNILLPSAGTYWLYTRFQTDDVFATWTENLSINTALVARRTGICTGAPGTCNNPADRTFFSAFGPPPGFSVVFDAGPNAVPEPGGLALVAVALGALLWVSRQRAA